MKREQKWFQLYAGHPTASNLSIAGGAVKLFSLFLLIAAVLSTLALLLAGLRLTMAGGPGTALIFLMDEMDDEVFTAFFLWGAVAALRYIACVLQSKAELLARPRSLLPRPIPPQRRPSSRPRGRYRADAFPPLPISFGGLGLMAQPAFFFHSPPDACSLLGFFMV